MKTERPLLLLVVLAALAIVLAGLPASAQRGRGRGGNLDPSARPVSLDVQPSSLSL